MAAFEYLALDPRGREQKGLIEADSPRQARQLLREKQWAPLEVKQAKSKEDVSRGGLSFGRGLSARDLALVTRQLATLVQAALPIEEALRAAAAQSTSAKIKSMLLAVRARVMEGHSLAAALREYPSAFPELYRATVAAGEHAGHLGLVLDQLADYTDQRQQSRQKIQLALLYPVILMVASLAIVVLLLGYVVPDVVKVFVNTGQELPALTRGLIATSDVVKNWGWLIVLGLIGAFLAMRAALRDPALRLRWHAFILRIPLIGRLSRATNTARFASTLAILTKSGVPLVEALSIAAAVIANLRIRERVVEAAQKVREGSSLTRALDATGEFPPMMLHMIASGEKSGELDQMLARTARNQENDLAAQVSLLVGLFEPFMLVFMGAVVLVIVLAILMPILSLNQLVG
ncbi:MULTISPECIES: GspF family T2SS innner membrane protein variant XcpS [Stutzerimonas stutzeri subgroup]|jgi:general secretion pathway protein F|uniref:GspF family T2SS innner membrane protein variant XcpS n=2 Tax=Stutzerimonas stutzeri subgroup TaxID=578833 RepID=A0ACC5VLK8_STUCH|nr:MULTISPECIES: GspF family T2SS innner membrane protein variant XcpS [Stutzerimonas stutzeri subgroup]MAF87042.1 type II secretion system protein GspF [Pseudomonas sp.]CEG54220.1 general secretion pathway protein F [Stutzerimonas xanthomarina]KKJ97956.1 general secretion pathway protein GspF [Stutzerimonas stutzeri]MAK88283.1 type II secretion system protein GspF [Pseudomonas sp.]MBD3875081.1 GspF family T2SS innner membrane protein variant XcpS [Stutzerimonas kunmingensis]|tara:strand:- start:6116 stop:7330 length:1215 start_codon:yes stop_codon:yes gene_type:complete